MRPPRVRFTIRWLMTRIAVFAAAVAFLVASDREGGTNGCGTPFLNAGAILLALATVYLVIRTVRFGIQHAS